jgi:hypothetical protein
VLALRASLPFLRLPVRSTIASNAMIRYDSVFSCFDRVTVAGYYSELPSVAKDNSELSYSFILAVIGSLFAFVNAGLACGMVDVK